MTHYQRTEPRWTRRAAARLLFGAGAALCLSSWPRMAPPYAMLKRTIPSSGETLPVVGLGTWLTFDIGADEAARARRREVLLTLLDSGGTLVDSSPMYGRSEEVIGQLSAGLPGGERLFKATKVWIRGREAGIEQMRESMRRMGAEPVDLMQVHNLVDWRTHLATLRAWKADGRVRYIGITHYLASAYEEVESILRAEPLDFLQINYSLRTPQAEDRLFPLALDKGVAVIVNRPFEGGDFFRATRGKSLPSLAAELGCRSWAQYCLKYILSHPAVTCVIPGTTNPEHMRENAQAGAGSLPDERTRAHARRRWALRKNCRNPTIFRRKNHRG